MTDTLDRVRRIVAKELDMSPDEIKPEHAIQRNLGADSLGMMQIAMAVEEEFDISVEDSEIEDLITVADIVRAVDAKVPATAV